MPPAKRLSPIPIDKSWTPFKSNKNIGGCKVSKHSETWGRIAAAKVPQSSSSGVQSANKRVFGLEWHETHFNGVTFHKRFYDLCFDVPAGLHGDGRCSATQNFYSERLTGCAKPRLYTFI